MKNSLSDQLLNLGLTDKKKVQETKTEKRKQKKRQKGGQPSTSEQQALKQAVAQARAEKEQRDRDLNQQLQEERQLKAIEAQIRQLIEQHALDLPKDADLPYQFVHLNKVKKLYITPQLQNQLIKGWLAIAILDQAQYRIIPDPIAERIEQRDPERVIRVTQESNEIDEEDPYKDYPIPDDLMW